MDQLNYWVENKNAFDLHDVFNTHSSKQFMVSLNRKKNRLYKLNSQCASI